jgi:cytochrome P450/ferredoxin-NADP reductase
MTSAPMVPHYDPFAPDFYTSDPFGVYRWMRDDAPVYWSERYQWWALTRFEDVRAAALDADTFRSFEGMDIDDSRLEQVPPGSIGSMDSPRHDQVRSVVQPYFLPRRIAQLENGVRAVVRELVASWRDRGTVDLAQELAWPMPFDVFFHLMGLPSRQAGDPVQRAQREQLEHWTHELKDRVPGTPHLTPVARAATAGVQEYFIDLLDERRRNPGGDLVTEFVQADIDGVPFVEETVTPDSEVSGLMLILFLGGVESTAGLTGTLFKLLAENPDQRALLQADPSLIPAAVEEAMRLITPLQLTARTTSREVTLHGVTIPAGGRVVLIPGAANRDERQFPDPDRFDITRPRGRHLGFGEGVHGCLGAPLARLEARVALEEALPVLGDYELAGPPGFYPSSPNMYVWKHLPVTFSAGGQRAAADRPPHVEAVHHRTTTTTLATSEFEATARVAAKHAASDGVVALTLREIDDRPLPAWEPGAHVDLVLDGAPTRQYSLCGDPADHSGYRLGVLRDPDGRGSSRYVHDRLQVGDTVRVRGPRNNFPLVGSQRYLFIAGGIGITAMLPMVAAAAAAGADWRLVYGGRRRAAMAFLDELTGHGDRVSIRPQDETGLLDLDALLGVLQEGTLVYCCGPEPLLAAVEQRCAGWPTGSLHVERFAPKPLTDPVRQDTFEIVLARSELTLPVPPDRSILEVVEAAGVGVLSSCAEGTCGTCETGVLEGDPDHRDSVLTPEERQTGGCLMICVSRSVSPRLVLDL